MEIRRTLRKQDSTITLDGVRFQIPQQYSHIDSILLRYSRWDLGEAEILCPDTHKSLCLIYPLNKLENSNALRKNTESKVEQKNSSSFEEENGEFLDLNTHQIPPLLAHLLRQHALQYPLSGYIPLSKKEDNSDE
jgi:hypothetical protein